MSSNSGWDSVFVWVPPADPETGSCVKVIHLGGDPRKHYYRSGEVRQEEGRQQKRAK